MKTKRMAGFLLMALLAIAVAGRAQEKPPSKEERRPTTALKIQVVFSEFDGEKKVSSLPYIFYVNDDTRSSGIRMGLRVPIVVTTKDAPSAIQYMDVGTDVDCTVRSEAGDRFVLWLTVRRSSLYSAASDKQALDWKPGDAPLSAQPIIRQFSSTSAFVMKDGQILQTTLAADPVSGRVLKVDLTLTVLR